MGTRKESLLALSLSILLVIAAMGAKGQVQPAEAATALGQLAVSMEPGTWAMLETTGLDELLDAYYERRGWDSNGIPTEATLDRVGLGDLSKN